MTEGQQAFEGMFEEAFDNIRWGDLTPEAQERWEQPAPVRALLNLGARTHLVGSRALKLHQPTSDYDYLVEEPGPWLEHEKLWQKLIAIGFTDTGLGSHYGPDPHARVFAYRDAACPVDAILVQPEEFARRVAFFEALRAWGNKRSGEFHRAMKSEKAWPLLWAALRGYEAKP